MKKGGVRPSVDTKPSSSAARIESLHKSISESSLACADIRRKNKYNHHHLSESKSFPNITQSGKYCFCSRIVDFVHYIYSEGILLFWEVIFKRRRLEINIFHFAKGLFVIFSSGAYLFFFITIVLFWLQDSDNLYIRYQLP